MENKIIDTLLVGANFENGIETGVLIIGRKEKGKEMTVINAFQGQEAMNIYNRLITHKNGDIK